jgi:glutamyl-tRNA reductase
MDFATRAGGRDLEPTLMVVGLNHRTAPLAVRERFWIGENRRYEVLRQLRKAEGIDEAVVLSNTSCTEFFLWAGEPTLAANSLLQFLTDSHGLKLSEWEHFYRLLDEAALAHIFRVTAGLDSLPLRGFEISKQVKSAWEQAHAVGAAGRFLSVVLEASLRVAEQVLSETAIEQTAVSIPKAALEITRQTFGSVDGRKVLLLGTGDIIECAGRQLLEGGASSAVVIDQSADRAQELALALGGTAATIADRWKYLLRADIVITSSGCPHIILTREEAEHIAQERNRVAMVILDVAMPRDVDPEVRRVDGILLHDLESLERVLESTSDESRVAAEEAERIIAREALAFRGRLRVENGAPTAMNLRRRLDELCRQELDSFIRECGPFSREQDRSLHAVTGQLTQKIASFLARELKEVPEKEEQERMATAISRLFHLDSPHEAIAGTISQKESRARERQKMTAVNY